MKPHSSIIRMRKLIYVEYVILYTAHIRCRRSHISMIEYDDYSRQSVLGRREKGSACAFYCFTLRSLLHVTNVYC